MIASPIFMIMAMRGCGSQRGITLRSPSVVRVSAAERARFQPVVHLGEQSKTAPPPSAKVAELNSVRTESRANLKNTVNTIATISAATTANSQFVPQRSVTALERSAQPQKTAGYSRQLMKKTKSLTQELLEEARQIEPAKRGQHRVAKQTASWLSRLLGGSKN